MLELKRLLAVAADTYNSLVEQVHPVLLRYVLVTSSSLTNVAPQQLRPRPPVLEQSLFQPSFLSAAPMVTQAVAAEVTLPADAQTHVPPPDLRLEWDNQATALAADWHDFEDEGRI